MPLKFDTELVNRAKASEGGLEHLLALVWPEAFRMALSILRDRGLAEDAAQEACVTVARSLPTLNDDGAFAGWCYKIIVSKAISTSRQIESTDRLDALTSEPVHLDNCEAVDLYGALSKLSRKERGAIMLRYYVGLDSREIAEATGLPRGTVRFHLMVARRRLRKALAVDERTTTRSEEALSDAH